MSVPQKIYEYLKTNPGLYSPRELKEITKAKYTFQVSRFLSKYSQRFPDNVQAMGNTGTREYQVKNLGECPPPNIVLSKYFTEHGYNPPKRKSRKKKYFKSKNFYLYLSEKNLDCIGTKNNKHRNNLVKYAILKYLNIMPNYQSSSDEEKDILIEHAMIRHKNIIPKHRVDELYGLQYDMSRKVKKTEHSNLIKTVVRLPVWLKLLITSYARDFNISCAEAIREAINNYSEANNA